MTTSPSLPPRFARFASGPDVHVTPAGLRDPFSARAWRALPDSRRAEHLAEVAAREETIRAASHMRGPRTAAPVAVIAASLKSRAPRPAEAARAPQIAAEPGERGPRWWARCAVCSALLPADSPRPRVVTCRGPEGTCTPAAVIRRRRRLGRRAAA